VDGGQDSGDGVEFHAINFKFQIEFDLTNAILKAE
jgi:hypothetical protein